MEEGICENSAGPEIREKSISDSGRWASLYLEMQVYTVQKIWGNRDHLDAQEVPQLFASLEMAAIGNAARRVLRSENIRMVREE